MSSLERRSLTRRATALFIVLAFALPAIVSSNRVALRVDGIATDFRTYAATVGDVLDNQGVELAAGDVVVPPPYAPIEDGTAIRILRTIEVGLVIDDQSERRVRGTFRSVGGMLESVGITDVDGLAISADLHAGVRQGDVVQVRSPRRVTVRVDGQTLVRDTHLSRVDLLLVELGVEVGEGDLIDVPTTTTIADGMTVTIQRVATETVSEEVVLDFAATKRNTDALYVGQSRVAQKGEAGLRIDTYRLTFVDGQQTARDLISEEIVTEPVDRIVEVGTKPKPKPAASTSSAPASGSVWYQLAACESGLRWSYNGPSGYDGGLQFHPSTWTNYKPAGYPQYAYQASPAQQIEVGKRVKAAQGWRAWPSCAKKLGLY